MRTTARAGAPHSAEGATANGHWPPGDSDLIKLIRGHDWGSTPLGPLQRWPQSLKTVVELALASHIPMVTLWGPDLIMIYNDGYRRIMGPKHPAGLGGPLRTCWAEVWPLLEPIFERVLGGETVSQDNALYPVDRGRGLEKTWFSLSYSPLRSESGEIAGAVVFVSEIRRLVNPG